MRWVPTVAAAVVVAVLVISYLAFPNVQTRTVVERVEVDPYASFQQSGVAEEQINGEFGSRCVYRENRRGITQGTSPPQESDIVVVVCRVYRLGGGS